MGAENPLASRYAQTADVINDSKANGKQYGYINTFAPGEVGRLTSGVLTQVALSTRYTLTVSLGRGLNIGASRYTIELVVNNTSVATQSREGSTIPSGTFVELTTTFESPSSGPQLGTAVQVRLTHSNVTGTTQNLQGHFDNVRLDASPVTVTYTVTPSAGANGSISPNSVQSVGSGGSISFTATPASGYAVNQWLVNGSLFQTGGNTCTLSNITADRTIQVTFTPSAPATYTVTPSAGANGGISPSTAQTVSSGGSVSFTATPNSGYVVDQWLVNGSVAQTGGTSYSLTNLTANAAVHATFARADGLSEPFPAISYVDVILQAPGKGSTRPVLAARGRNSGQIMVVRGVYNRKPNVPIRMHTVIFADPERPENVIRVLFSPKGDPVRINIAGQGRVDFTMLKKQGTVRAIMRDQKGKIIARTDNFASLIQNATTRAVPLQSERVIKESTPGTRAIVYHTPGYINPEDFVTPEELALGLQGTPDAVGSISSFVDQLTDWGNDYIDRVRSLAVGSGPRGGPIATVLHFYVANGADLLVNQVESKALRIVNTFYELTNDLKELTGYVTRPTLANFPDAAASAVNIANSAQDLGTSATVLLDSNGQPVAVDEATTETPPGTDQERSEFVGRRVGTAGIVLNGTDDCYRLDDITIRSNRLLDVVVKEQTFYFRSISSLAGWCQELAGVTASISLGTSFRQSAYDAVSGFKLSLVEEVAAQVTKVGEELGKQREGKTVHDQNIVNLTANIQILEASGQAKPAQITVLREGLNDLIAQAPVFDENIATCLALLENLGSLNAQVRNIDLSSL